MADGVEILMTPSEWTVEGALDGIQLALDVAGFVPIIGDALDGVNGVISLARGDKVGAALSFAAMVPVVGSAVGAGGKIAKFAGKKVDDVLAIAKDLKCKITKGCFARGTNVWIVAADDTNDQLQDDWLNDRSLVSVQHLATTKTAIESVALGSCVQTQNPVRSAYDWSLPKPDRASWSLIPIDDAAN